MYTGVSFSVSVCQKEHSEIKALSWTAKLRECNEIRDGVRAQGVAPGLPVPWDSHFSSLGLSFLRGNHSPPRVFVGCTESGERLVSTYLHISSFPRS